MSKSMNNVPEELVKDIEKSREKLRLKKYKVYTKLMNYLKAEKNESESAMSLLDWAYDFECNFQCPHCCASAFRLKEKREHLSLDKVRHIADEADKLGIFVINLIGGEPLIWKDFDNIVSEIDPTRFHISITTNGWMLTYDKARHLEEIGIDKIGVSIDSGIEEEHDSFRNKQGSFRKAIEALKNAHKAGIRTMISTVVTHQNIHTEGFKKLLELSETLNIGLDLQCSTVSGGWRGNYEVLIDKDDANFLEELRIRYPLLRRDVWSTPGSKGGCPAATRSVYIIPSGDVLPCLFIHISFGNIFRESLDVIQQRMIKIHEFRNYSKFCFAGEDRRFINSYLSKTFNTNELPLNYIDIFTDRYNSKINTGD